MKTPSIDWTKQPNVAVLDGSEDYFKDTLVARARETLDAYQYVLLWAGKDSDKKIQSHLFEGSLIPTQKLVVIRDANRVDDDAFLKRYCESPNPNHVVILVASGGRKPKWFGSLKCNEKVKCTSPKPWEYKDWIVQYCRSKGFTLDEKYAEPIHSNVGDDLYALSNELEKVFLNMDDRTTVTASDITSVLVQHQTISPFNVLESWGNRQQDVALRMATVYFHQSSDRYAALPMLALFLGHIEKLIAFESYKKNEFGKRDVCDLMGISHYVYDKLNRQSIHWSLRQLRKAYRSMCEIESAVKLGKNGPLLINWFLSQDFEE
jgi:DNA polymerase-3 subunit delta